MSDWDFAALAADLVCAEYAVLEANVDAKDRDAGSYALVKESVLRRLAGQYGGRRPDPLLMSRFGV